MAKRIQELQKQAFDFVANQNMTKKEYFWENIRHNRELQDCVDAKFAELIVKECASVALNTDLEDVEGGDSAVLRAAKLQILEYFRIEEQ